MNQPRVEDRKGSAGLPARAELLVVGGGLAGLLAAWRGAAAGLQTLVLDSPQRHAAASVAAGMIAPVGEVTWGEDRLLALVREAAARWPQFAQSLSSETGCPVPYRRSGAIHVALDRDEAAELRRRDQLLSELHLESEPLLGSAARRLEPGLATAVAAGTLAPGEAEVDPRALLEALRVAALGAGARIASATVRSVTDQGRVSIDAGTELDAERVLIAAGAWAGEQRLLAERPRLPVRPVKGVIVRLRAESGALPCKRIIVGERFYLVPRENGELVLGASTEERGYDLRVTAGAVHELLREAYRALPELAELELIETAAGLRPGTPDNVPIFGSVAGTRLAVAAGLYRNGVLLAPLLAAGFDEIFGGAAAAGPLAGLEPAGTELHGQGSLA